MESKIYDRILGCLLAGALGDSIGARFEGETAPKFVVPDNLRVTDDTQLTIATCESIIAAKSVDPESIGNRMAEWFRDRRLSGIGASTLKALTEINEGGHWAMTGATGERSAGNGAAMRISPLAFFLDPNEMGDRTMIRDVSRITHRNDEAYLGALAIVYVIANNSLDLSVIEDLIVKLPESRMRDRFIEISKNNLSAKQLANKYPVSGFVVDSVPFSILTALESSGLMESIKLIVECGGDTDTTASMFGNIFGAIHGSAILPMEIVQQIDDFELISKTAIDLAGVADRINSDEE